MSEKFHSKKHRSHRAMIYFNIIQNDRKPHTAFVNITKLASYSAYENII